MTLILLRSMATTWIVAPISIEHKRDRNTNNTEHIQVY